MLFCGLCQTNFINYGSYLSHVCYGQQSAGAAAAPKAKFSCRLCTARHDLLPTFLDFQTHMRKLHNVCEICLEVMNI
jgi:hypothetical protein